MITLNNVSVTFGKDTPLQNKVFNKLNLQINQGEFLTVIGGNGAGKSTLMNVLSGVLPIDEGSIILDGINVTNWLMHERAQLISRVFQDPLLGTYADLSIEENLSLGFCRNGKHTIKKALNNNLREYFRSCLASINIGLENRFSDRMGLLSGGQRQAISLIMATLQPSKILLLDEHTSALDLKMERCILELTQQLITEKQLTVLMITHCMSQAIEFGTRTLVMYQGNIVKDLKDKERKKLKPKDLMQFF